MDTSVAVFNAGLVTSVGLNVPASCAAIRVGLTNPTETRFVSSDGEWIMAHQVHLSEPWRGRAKLVRMLARALEECLVPVPRDSHGDIALLLCVAEPERPGRTEGLDRELLVETESMLGTRFHPVLSGTLAYGRVGALVALARARELLAEGALKHVVIAAADSLVVGPTLATLDTAGRLLTPSNSNGFMPGEAAGALLVSSARYATSSLICSGLGFATERCTIATEEPLRAEGLTAAIKMALDDARCQMGDLDFRITDNSGEQYYFREATLALSRILRVRKESFDMWHPADCIGDVGAAIGIVSVAVALTSCRKRYTRGERILLHFGTDSGHRGAAVLVYAGAA